MNQQSFNNAFDAIADTPQEAMNLNLRSQLMDILCTHIKKVGWDQIEAAKNLGVTQPRIADLYRGKLSLFSMDALVNMLSGFDKKVELSIKMT